MVGQLKAQALVNYNHVMKEDAVPFAQWSAQIRQRQEELSLEDEQLSKKLNVMKIEHASNPPT